MESIVNAIINLFSGIVALKFGKEVIVFIISILPILELRGGLLAASLFQLLEMFFQYHLYYYLLIKYWIGWKTLKLKDE